MSFYSQIPFSRLSIYSFLLSLCFHLSHPHDSSSPSAKIFMHISHIAEYFPSFFVFVLRRCLLKTWKRTHSVPVFTLCVVHEEHAFMWRVCETAVIRSSSMLWVTTYVLAVSQKVLRWHWRKIFVAESLSFYRLLTALCWHMYIK